MVNVNLFNHDGPINFRLAPPNGGELFPVLFIMQGKVTISIDLPTEALAALKDELAKAGAA